MVVNDSWDIQLKRNLKNVEIREVTQLFQLMVDTPNLTEEEDSIQCNGSIGFTTKFCYNWLIERSDSPSSQVPYSCIWIKHVPPKVQVFLWSAAQNAIATTNTLVRRGCAVNNMTCSLCSQEDETVSHLLLHCQITSQIWSYFLKGYNVKWVQSRDICSQLQAWKFRRGRNMGRKIWPLLMFAICWVLWDERNRRVMTGKNPRSLGTLINEVKAKIYKLGAPANWFRHNTFRDLITHWKVIIDCT